MAALVDRERDALEVLSKTISTTRRGENEYIELDFETIRSNEGRRQLRELLQQDLKSPTDRKSLGILFGFSRSEELDLDPETLKSLKQYVAEQSDLKKLESKVEVWNFWSGTKYEQGAEVFNTAVASRNCKIVEYIDEHGKVLFRRGDGSTMTSLSLQFQRAAIITDPLIQVVCKLMQDRRCQVGHFNLDFSGFFRELSLSSFKRPPPRFYDRPLAILAKGFLKNQSITKVICCATPKRLIDFLQFVVARNRLFLLMQQPNYENAVSKKNLVNKILRWHRRMIATTTTTYPQDTIYWVSLIHFTLRSNVGTLFSDATIGPPLSPPKPVEVL